VEEIEFLVGFVIVEIQTNYKKFDLEEKNQLSVFTLVPTAQATLVHIIGISEGAS
jgi:hypothetical protein